LSIYELQDSSKELMTEHSATSAVLNAQKVSN